MEPSQLKRRKNSFKEENLEKVPLISKDDDLVKPKPTSGLSVKRIVKTFFRALWYLPLFISIGGVLLLFAIQLKHCGGPECGMKCMSGSFNDWEGCVQECKCWFVPPAFWLQPFRAEHSVHHDEDRIANCPNGYAFTPKLQPLSENPPVKRPNFVLILLDDQDEMVSPYMEAMPFTRELFEKNGTRFTQAFSSTSLCCPARCQLLTGLYGHNTGVLYNTGPFGGREGFVHPRYTNGTRMKNEEGKCINNEYRDAASLLKENGQYSSGIFGKYISGVEYGELGPKPPGWSDFHVGADHKIYFGYHYSLYNWTEGMENVEYEFRNYDKSDYLTDVLRDRAVQFIDRQRVGTSEEKPLFMFMAPTAPHFPIHAAPRHKHMEGYWASRFDEIVASRPSFYNMTDVLTSKSKWLINDIPRRFALKENPFTRADFVKRMTSLMAVDEMIEAIYRKLENLGEANNTIFVFSSDNGYNFGAHGLAHKMTPYEESVRVPLYISGPGFPRGKNVTEMTALIDVLPTFLESSGFQVPNYMDGFSLIPKMKSGEPQLQHKRKAVLLEYKGLTPYYANATMEEEIPGRFAARNPPAGLVNCDTPPFKAIRTEDHMLVDYIYFYKNDPRYSEKDEIETIMEKTDHEYELYDLKKDPYQMNNLFKEHGKNSEVFQKLMADMKKLQKCSGKNCYSL